MKKLLRLAMPPFVILGARKIAELIRHRRFRRSLIDNYNNDSLTRMIVEKNLAFRNELSRNKTIDLGAMRTVVGACLSTATPNKAIRVLDVGGGGGYHYFITRLVLDDHIKIDWRVIETDSMVRSARELATNELKFFSSIREAIAGVDGIDLILASSSLQYFSDQNLVINEMLQVRARNIFITRTPFSLTEPAAGEQQHSLLSSNGPGPLPSGYEDQVVAYPIFIMNLDEFLGKFTPVYDIKFRIKEESPGFRINGKYFDNYGFYFTLRSTQNN
jgi:putative methyltransferase (TIGR04325 family)